MGSHKTMFTLVNNTDTNIGDIGVKVNGNGDWDGDSRPDHNFRGHSIGAWSSRTARQELNSNSDDAPFTMTLHFATGESVTLHIDQYDARGNQRRRFPLSGKSAGAFQAFQAAADDANSIAVSRVVDPKDWMKRVPGSTPLNEITLPGTHDTGTWPGYGGASPTCQSLTLKQQLEAGIRFIDIRLVQVGSDFRVHHASVNEHLTFSTDIVEVCRTFLTDHPDEVIVMSVKHEMTITGKNQDEHPVGTFEEALLKLLPTDLRYDSTAIPTREQAKKHIVLLRRYPGSAGIDATDWPDDDHDSRINGAHTLHIQDAYGMAATSIQDKWRLVKKYLLEAKAQAKADHWWLNFSSASGGGFPDHFAKGANSAESGVNTLMFDFLVDQRVGSWGTIVMDFPEYPDNKALIDLIISLNKLDFSQG